MNKDCCYDMARDIFICHLGMSEVEAEKQVAQMFQSQLQSKVAAVSVSKVNLTLKMGTEKVL